MSASESLRGVGDGSPTGGENVLPMLPTWPEVRCDRCRTVYTMPEDRRRGIVSGNCPQCHYVVFSTSIDSGAEAVTFDFDSFGGGARNRTRRSDRRENAMTWWQQTVARLVLFVARLVALAEGQDEIAAEIKALSNHITTYRKPSEPDA